MSRIFITGSADGLGMLAAKKLVSLGHRVVLHARDPERGQHALLQVPGAEQALYADLSDMQETKNLAARVNALGHFDAVIHNAAVLYEDRADAGGLPLIFKINSLAPYILTCLINKPKRLIYMSSAMHQHGDASLRNLPGDQNTKPGSITYSDTKLHDLLICLAVSRRWKDVYANALHPGWVPTKMGGAGAPDSLEKGYETQVWLAVSTEPEALVSGKYFFHKKQREHLRAAADTTVQEKFLAACERMTGVKFPG
jgi:NAD(P)-dependent dehydrogenase (short-subunit alcohol dehydrogenase family)